MFGAGAQRLISLAIGALAAVALVITLTVMFGTTQPYRAGHQPAVITE